MSDALCRSPFEGHMDLGGDRWTQASISAIRCNAERSTRYGRMIYNRFDAYVGRCLDLYGEFSEGEVQLFRRIVKAGMHVLDVGANIGAHTIPLGQLVGVEGKVLAFEPQRMMFYLLCGNIALNSALNIHAYNVAVGAAPGRGMMPRCAYLAEHNFAGMALGDWPDGIPVDVVSLDAMPIERVDFLKVDVEGMELDVLLGATRLLRAHQPVLYVENDRHEKAERLCDCLVRDLKYRLWWHLPPLFNADNWDRNQFNAFPNIVSLNMLCLPEGRDPAIYGLRVADDAARTMGNMALWPVVNPRPDLPAPAAAADQAGSYEQIFTSHGELYRGHGCESLSGPGSSLAQTHELRKHLPRLLDELAVCTLLDAPCGDFNWMQHLQLGAREYIGIDIQGEIIAANQGLHSAPHRWFLRADIVRDLLPRADAILCRDLLTHLSVAEIRQGLANFKRSGAIYLMTTTFTGPQANHDIAAGNWRPLNLTLPPFSFPPPLHLINEKCTENGGAFSDKSLGVWRLQDLPV